MTSTTSMNTVYQILVLFHLAAVGHAYISRSDAQRLYTDLTTGYDPRLRPTADQNATTTVALIAQTVSVMELSTSEQRLAMLMTYPITWQDELLIWNTSEYGGIDKLVFNIDDVWYPKLLVGFSYANYESHIYDSKSQVTVSSTGLVVWTPSTSVSVHCIVDIAFYPFDTQNCILYVYVPYTSGHELELQLIDNYVPLAPEGHPEWHLLNVGANVVNVPIETALINSYVFRRRAVFVVYTTIVPLILLSILNACVVLVPVSSGEKGSIAVTLFLSYCVYLTSIGQTLPPNSIKSSYLLIYTTIVQVFSALTMLYSIIQTRIYINGNGCGSRFACGFKSHQIHTEETVLSTKDMGDAEHVGEQKNGLHGTTIQIGDEMKDGQDQPGNEDSLRWYRKVDNILFVLCILLNGTMIVVLSALVVQNMQSMTYSIQFD